MNAAWHERHPMPKNATLEQRVAWHVKHAKACACRPIPASVAAHIRRPPTPPTPKKRTAGTPLAVAGKAAPADYSGTPLAAKLGLEAGKTVLLMNEPPNYTALIGDTFGALKKVEALGKGVDVVHLFTAARSGLTDRLQRCRRDLRDNAVVWVSWPKKSSGVPTDITEQTIRDVALPMGFVDIKVCAVDDIWSGLKLMVRKDLRRR